jgi:hypothetical protein
MQTIIDHIGALLDSVTTSQLAAVSPLERRRLADSMWRVLHQMSRIDDPPPPKAGVLNDLSGGRQA